MLEQLLKDLGARKRSVREEAIHKARALPPDALLELLEKNDASYQRRYHRERLVFYPVLLVCFLSTCLIAWGSAGFDWPSWLAPMALLPLALLPPLFLSVGGVLIVEKRAADKLALQSLAAVLADVENPDFIAAALLWLSMPLEIMPPKTWRNVRQTLERLLPHLKPEQAAQWTQAQRQALISPVQWMAADSQSRNSRYYEDRFALALRVLKVLEQVGDERELICVQRLATLSSRTEKDRQLKRAAQECLPYLEIRAEEHRQAQTLLRASSATVSPDTLLRPAASHATETPPEELLRPHSPP